MAVGLEVVALKSSFGVDFAVDFAVVVSAGLIASTAAVLQSVWCFPMVSD